MKSIRTSLMLPLLGGIILLSSEAMLLLYASIHRTLLSQFKDSLSQAKRLRSARSFKFIPTVSSISITPIMISRSSVDRSGRSIFRCRWKMGRLSSVRHH